MSRSIPAGWFHRLVTPLDEFGLLFVSIFLVIFIPLYPKLPLFDAIPGYLVKVRLEDILILLTGVWWLSEVIRRKIVWWNSLVLMMILYAGVGFISICSGVVLLQTIPFEPLHLGKSVLHYFRYLEYFSLFVFIFSSIKTLKQVKVVLGLLSVAVMVIVIYAVGQLYWEWPVFSTMNREYSKGAALTLGQDARVQSTFAGHYDLSAFLVLLLPYLLMAALTHPRWWTKIWFGGVVVLGSWLLVETGSKFSLVAGVIGIILTILVYLRRYPRAWLSAISLGCLGLILGLGALSFVWFNPQNPQVVATLHGVRQSPLVSKIDVLARGLDTISLKLAQRQLAAISVATDPEVSPIKPSNKSDDDQPQWSENTLKYGLSMGIRLDTLWPQALRGLARNLLWGSGYGTLNKTGKTMFVEADSTDNNLLRTLGETGLLGFATFYLIIWFAFRSIWRARATSDWITDSIRIGFLGATVGIILNGLMIDVFVASKVAFTFWALVGLSYKTLKLSQPTHFAELEETRFKRLKQLLTDHWPILVSLLLLVSVLQRNPLIQTGQIANLAVDPTETEALTTVRCWMTERTWTLCRPGEDMATSTSYFYGGILLAAYQISQIIGTFYYVNLFLALISLVALYLTARTFFTRKDLVFGLCLMLIGMFFISQVVLIPIDENLAIALLSLVLMSSRRWWISHQNVWLAISFLIVAAFFTVIPAMRMNWWWVVTAPFWCLLVMIGIDTAAKHVLIRTPLRSLANPLLIVVGGVVVAQQVVQQQLLDLKKEYQAESQNWNVQSVRVLNDFFGGEIASVPITNAQTPLVIMALPPDFIELYREYPYTAYSLGDFDKLQGRIENSQVPTFLSNTALTTTEDKEKFQQVRQRYDLDLVTEGCAENCNLYTVNAQPSLYSEQILKDINQYTFMIFNQSFVIDDRTSVQLLRNQLTRLRRAGYRPDFVIAIGDRSTQLDIEGVPVYFVGNSSSPEVMNQFMALRTPHDLLLFLNSSRDGSISLNQHLKHLNALLDEELNPSLKNIFVISDRFQTVVDDRLTQLLPYTERTVIQPDQHQNRIQLERYIDQSPAESVFYVSGDFGLVPNAFPAVLYQKAADGKSVSLASSVRWRPNDVVIRVDISESGQAAVNAVRLTDVQPIPIEEFDSNYWLNNVPPRK